MIKQEINELKRLYTPSNCSITRICGCYVDGEKNKKTEFKEAFRKKKFLNTLNYCAKPYREVSERIS